MQDRLSKPIAGGSRCRSSSREPRGYHRRRRPQDARHLKYPGCGTDPNHRPCYTWSNAGVKMTAETIEKLITNSIHTAFVKYPEGDGGPNLDYTWIPPEHS